MFVNDFPDLPSIRRREAMGKCLLDIEAFRVQPVFAFHVFFATVNMDGLIPLIGVEK